MPLIMKNRLPIIALPAGCMKKPEGKKVITSSLISSPKPSFVATCVDALEAPHTLPKTEMGKKTCHIEGMPF